jgi:hypothetical protein
MQKRNSSTRDHSQDSTPESEGRVSFYPIAPEDNIPVQYHNDMNRHLSLRKYNVEIDTISGNQIVIISKR